MSYIGNNLQVAYPTYKNIDDISGSFDGVTTSFPLTVGGVAPVPAPLGSNQCLISVAGVVQRPDDTGTEGFRLSGGNIIFSSAPTGGDDFFGVILAGADYVNVGVNFPSGTAGAPSITFDADLDTGIYNSAANELAIATAGVSRLVVSAAGNITTTGSFVDPKITGTILEDVYTISDGAAFEVDPGNGSVQLITLGANRTPKATNFAAGESLTLMVDDGAAYTLTWTDSTWGGSGVVWTGGSAPTLATSGYTVLQFWKVGTQVYGAYVGDVA